MDLAVLGVGVSKGGVGVTWSASCWAGGRFACDQCRLYETDGRGDGGVPELGSRSGAIRLVFMKQTDEATRTGVWKPRSSASVDQAIAPPASPDSPPSSSARRPWQNVHPDDAVAAYTTFVDVTDSQPAWRPACCRYRSAEGVELERGRSPHRGTSGDEGRGAWSTSSSGFVRWSLHSAPFPPVTAGDDLGSSR